MPARKPVSEFMLSLTKRLMDARGIAETTATEYITQLKRLNEDKSFANLGFLKKREAIMTKVGTYAESTQKSVLASIVSVLSLEKDKPTYKAIYNFYYERMMEASKKSREQEATGERTEKQDANWITWEEVMKRHNELAEAVAQIGKGKMLTTANWNALLSYVILSLYVLLPPRRNQDYQDLYIVKKWDDKLSKDKNYYDMTAQKFIFNKFKTAKSHGVQEVSLSDNKPLADVLALYIKLHPSKGKGEMRFLVNADGSALGSVNSITRILNKIFGKHIGSSMLRHIYITHKYGDTKKEMEKDAEAMGHSVAEQQQVYNKPKAE
jgi:integrase